MCNLDRRNRKIPTGDGVNGGKAVYRNLYRFSSVINPKPTAFRNRFQRGQATLEILVVLLILIPLIFGGIELSRAVAVRGALDSGVGVMAQAISLDPSSNQWDWAAGVVQQTIDQNVFGTAGVDPLTLAASGSSGVIDNPRENMKNLPFGAGFCLQGWVKYTPLVPLLPLAPITLRVQHCGVIQKLN
jgi:hypothetical protein